jgi:hypothetical protein
VGVRALADGMQGAPCAVRQGAWAGGEGSNEIY